MGWAKELYVDESNRIFMLEPTSKESATRKKIVSFGDKPSASIGPKQFFLPL
jgi:hypothetical protein